MAKLLYQGHGSFRLEGERGVVIYVDPFAGRGYEKPADLILVTHQHSDHNQVSLVPRKEGCILLTEKEAIKDGEYQSFTLKGVKIEAAQAYNGNHDKRECVGYLITLDGVRIYAAGDTSETEQMQTMAARKLDYALLPCDGVYNMNVEEASRCADLIGARHTIPVHMKPGGLYDHTIAKRFRPASRLLLDPGCEIALKAK